VKTLVPAFNVDDDDDDCARVSWRRSSPSSEAGPEGSWRVAGPTFKNTTLLPDTDLVQSSTAQLTIWLRI